MASVARTILFAAAVLCVVTLSACSSDEPSSSPAASSPISVTELERLAHRFRSSETTTQAWWVAVPLSEAKSLLGTEYESMVAGRDLSSPLYAVILNGGFTGGDGETKYDWAVVLPEGSAIVLAERPDTPGHVWNSLPTSLP